MVAGVEFHDAVCPTGELALQVDGRTAVLGADQVRRGQVLPGRCLHLLLKDSQAVCAPTGTGVNIIVTQLRVKGI